MEAFFRKYPMRFSELTALKMIYKKIKCAKKAYKEHKKDKTNMEYMKYLAEAYRMIEDFFQEKGTSPNGGQY